MSTFAIYGADGVFQMSVQADEATVTGMVPAGGGYTMETPSNPRAIFDGNNWVDPAPTATEVRKAANDIIFQLAQPYEQGEIMTWFVQASEAAALAVNPAAETGFLDGVLKSGETMDQLRSRLNANREAFEAVGRVIGMQRTLLDMDPIPSNYVAQLQSAAIST
ncbi:MAG: hypothetical protein AAF801_09895 [Pseudomonadota bacterium]